MKGCERRKSLRRSGLSQAAQDDVTHFRDAGRRDRKRMHKAASPRTKKKQHAVSLVKARSILEYPDFTCSQGLRDIGGTLADDAGELQKLYLEFARAQFELLRKPNADELAADFIARLYGAFTLANALGDAAFLEAQLDRIEIWLEGSVHGSKRV